ncbi:MAG: glycosyltransferase involved in cell wall biosynthesis, partial [Salibacteraceae bacterium]
PEVTPNALKKEAFLFSIGIFNKKKNFHSLLHMMRNLDNYKLVIAGNNATNYGNEIKLLIREFSLQEKVILVGTITENEKSWYYKNCKALVFPSLAEGFGIPPIEAMMYGKPVFMSKLTSLPEIGGNVAFYFENFESDSMAKQIESGLTIAEIDSNFSSKSISYAAKFSWDTCIQKYLDVYRETLNI